LDLEPTLVRRYGAATAAGGLNELTTVAAEMERVHLEAQETGSNRIEGRALSALSDVVMLRDGDPAEAMRLATRALELLPGDDVEGRTEALRLLAATAWWPGDLKAAETYTQQAIALAEQCGRDDLWVRGMGTMQWLREVQLDFDGAEAALFAALER